MGVLCCCSSSGIKTVCPKGKGIGEKREYGNLEDNGEKPMIKRKKTLEVKETVACEVKKTK